jgi:hypothetical protein
MTEIRRITDPAIISEISRNFTTDGCYTRQVIAAELAARMNQMPDDTCVIVGYNAGKIVGFITAWIPPARGYVYLDNVWHLNTNEAKAAKDGFNMLLDWAKSKGLKEIRMETARNAAAILRRWGFEEHQIVMKRMVN